MSFLDNGKVNSLVLLYEQKNFLWVFRLKQIMSWILISCFCSLLVQTSLMESFFYKHLFVLSGCAHKISKFMNSCKPSAVTIYQINDIVSRSLRKEGRGKCNLKIQTEWKLHK